MKMYGQQPFPGYAAFPAAQPGQMPPGMQQQLSAPQIQQAPTLIGRQVCSREEVLAMPVAYDGTPMFLPDLPHGVIWVKQFDPNTGTATPREYRLTLPQAETKPQYITEERFCAEIQKIEDLRAELERLKGDLNAAK